VATAQTSKVFLPHGLDVVQLLTEFLEYPAVACVMLLQHAFATPNLQHEFATPNLQQYEKIAPHALMRFKYDSYYISLFFVCIVSQSGAKQIPQECYGTGWLQRSKHRNTY